MCIKPNRVIKNVRKTIFRFNETFFLFFFLKHPVKWSVSLQCARKKNFVRDEVKKATIYSEYFLDEKSLELKRAII
jgi:hypothetical protein